MPYDDEITERDDPQPEDLADLDYDDEDVTVRCPACGHSFFEGSSKCPRCGEWLIDDETPAQREVPGWLWPVVVAMIIAVILVVWHGLH